MKPDSASRSLSSLNRIWIAFMFSVSGYGLLMGILDYRWNAILPASQFHSGRQVFLLIASILFLIQFGARRVLLRMETAPGSTGSSGPSTAIRGIILMALSESIGLLGLISFLFIHDLTTGLILVALSCLALMTNRPSILSPDGSASPERYLNHPSE